MCLMARQAEVCDWEFAFGRCESLESCCIWVGVIHLGPFSHDSGDNSDFERTLALVSRGFVPKPTIGSPLSCSMCMLKLRTMMVAAGLLSAAAWQHCSVALDGSQHLPSIISFLTQNLHMSTQSGGS